MQVKKIALYGCMIALSFLFSYVESLIAVLMPFYGMKLGLANLVTVSCLYALGTVPAIVITGIRLLLVAFTFGNLNALLFSISGAVLSLGVMLLLRRTGLFGVIGVSTAGGVMHNVGQVLVAVALLGSAMWYYLALLMLGGIVAGALIGLLAACLQKRVAQAARQAGFETIIK